MKHHNFLTLAAILLATPTLCHSQTRAEALKPHLDRVWNRWAELPSPYRKQHRSTLAQYLGHFTTSNGSMWNHGWTGFTRSMGPEFAPFYADVVEAMKVAEAYESSFPDPKEKLPKIADALFENIPTNALFFVHNDVFETILLLRQEKGKRGDVLLVNSSRLMYPSYIQILLDRYPMDFQFKQGEISKAVINAALQFKDEGNAEFRDLHVVNGKVRSGGLQLATSLSFIMIQEISRSVSVRPVVFMPSLQKPGPVQAWRSLHGSGMFFTWKKPSANTARDPISEWQTLLDAVAPVGESLHGGMANAFGQSVHAAVGIADAQRRKQFSDRLLRMWGQRTKDVTMVSSRNIVIDEEGKMVQQDKSNVRGKPLR